jgi:hypothetical protein
LPFDRKPETPVSSWQIVKSGAIAPPSGGAFDAAYFVRLVCGSSTREVVVEFAAPSSVASCPYAEEVIRPFLGQDDPPEHIVVEPGGAVLANHARQNESTKD